MAEFDEMEMRIRVARLDGYLDALATINGRFKREFVMSAAMLSAAHENSQVDVAVTKLLASWEGRSWSVVSVEKLESWTDIERDFFPATLLSLPFGSVELAESELVAQVRSFLTWQATDALMFILSEDTRPNVECHRLVLQEPNAVRSEGYAFLYQGWWVFIHHIQWR